MLLDILPITARKKYAQQEKTLDGISAYLLTIEDGEVNKWIVTLFRDLTISGKETVNTMDVKEVQDKVREEVKKERVNIEAYSRAANKKDAEKKKEIVDNDLPNYCTKKTIFKQIKKETTTFQKQEKGKNNVFWKVIWSMVPVTLFFRLIIMPMQAPQTKCEWILFVVILVLCGVGIYPVFRRDNIKQYRWFFLVIGVILPFVLLIVYIILFNILKIVV